MAVVTWERWPMLPWADVRVKGTGGRQGSESMSGQMIRAQ